MWTVLFLGWSLRTFGTFLWYDLKGQPPSTTQHETIKTESHPPKEGQPTNASKTNKRDPNRGSKPSPKSNNSPQKVAGAQQGMRNAMTPKKHSLWCPLIIRESPKPVNFSFPTNRTSKNIHQTQISIPGLLLPSPQIKPTNSTGLAAAAVGPALGTNSPPCGSPTPRPKPIDPGGLPPEHPAASVADFVAGAGENLSGKNRGPSGMKPIYTSGPQTSERFPRKMFKTHPYCDSLLEDAFFSFELGDAT